MADEKDVYSFYKITDIDRPLQIRISSLVGKLERKSRTELLEHPEYRFWGSQVSEYPDLYVVCRLYADNKPLTPEYQTAYKQFHKEWVWNEWIQFPYQLNELPYNAQIGLTIYDTAGPGKVNVVGGTTFRLFGKSGTLRKAQHRLFVWRGKEADGSAETATPSKIGGMKDEMGRLEKLIKKHKRGDFPAVDWLDTLAYRQISLLNQAELESGSNMFLYIDMPQFELPVVYCEPEPKPVSLPPLPTRRDAAPQAQAAGVGGRAGASAIDASLFTILDPEIARDNPIEAKFRRMARNHRGDPLDQEMKPSADIRDQLNDILAYPPTRALSGDEMDLVWRFRFYLTRDPKGLTKFLKSVTWSDTAEATQATEVIMPQWTSPGIDDALELLGPGFKDARVRAYAVSVLERADDNELILYLLQLVQAIKFDNLALLSSSMRDEREGRPAGTLDRDAGNGAALDAGDTIKARPGRIARSQSNSVSIFGEHRLANFLIRRGIRNRELGNNLYWYLYVECEDKVQGSLYASVKQRFLDRLVANDAGDEGRLRRESLERQTKLMKTLSKWAVELRFSKDSRPRKIDKLRALISDPKTGLAELQPPLTLPLDATMQVTGVLAEKSTVFKSNQLPLYLHLVPAQDPVSSYPIIFKNGDDLRQDQLVMQLFTLMDRLLRNENLDLRMTPYKVLATGAEDGMVQFIESQSINAILSQYQGSLLNYLRKHHPDPRSEATYGVKPEVLDTYVRSCAGYSVLTYLLEVGDRHLDNLLLAPDGHFFHVDFGYILGRDPKPYPPPIRVTKEMIDAMGGVQSPHYARWKNHCFNAFIVLRKSANLILNLLALMIDSNVRDIQREPDKAVARVQERFCLHLKDADAIAHLDKLLTAGGFLGTVVTIMDTAHNVAQFIRS